MKGRLKLHVLIPAFLGVAFGVCLMFAVQRVRENATESLIRTQGKDLWNAYRLWVEAGKPAGEGLDKFAKRLDEWGWKHLEKNVEISGTTQRTLFCNPNIQPFENGTLSVTRDGKVIWEPKPEIVFEQAIDRAQ